jgi:DNA-binding CsgD family transcriptional regulator/PAS domain-containing protein
LRLAKHDELLSAIEGIHAAGLDEARWPQALAAVVRVVGGNAASIGVCDQQDIRHLEMHTYAMSSAAREVAFRKDFAEINIRLPFIARQNFGDLSCDYMILDEAAMKRAPLYTEILPRFDMRYFVGGVILKTESKFAFAVVHRPARMGHVQRDGIMMMRILTRHLSQSYDVARRLRAAEDRRNSLEATLDGLADGTAFVRADGTVVRANASFEAIVRRNDGIRLRKRVIEFADANAHARLASALAAIRRLRTGVPDTALASDFAVPRIAAQGPYLISVRPLMGDATLDAADAVAIVFVRDALRFRPHAAAMLRDRFGFTEAEAALAQALQSGIAPTDYARSNALSLNTVYTHLRRLREKTSCRRLPELIHRLNELGPPLQPRRRDLSA